MVIELCVVQFWSEIILVISNQTRAARSFDFEIKRMISDQISLHSVQLPLFINPKLSCVAINCSNTSNIVKIAYHVSQIHKFIKKERYETSKVLEFLKYFNCFEDMSKFSNMQDIF